MEVDRNDAIGVLCEEYPKTFFAIGKMRKPLKVGIEDDIKEDLFNRESELCYHNIPQAIEWYRSHVGYQLACAVPGAKRLDLDGEAAGTITEVEAREFEQEAEQSFRTINARKRVSAQALPPPAPPRPTALMVNAALNTAEMLALIEKQVAALKAILVGDAIDESLRPSLTRPVLALIRDELQTIDARLG